MVTFQKSEVEMLSSLHLSLFYHKSENCASMMTNILWTDKGETEEQFTSGRKHFEEVNVIKGIFIKKGEANLILHLCFVMQ